MRRLTEKQIWDSIRTIDFEPLKISLEDQKSNKANGDARLVIGWKNKLEYFLPEILGQATPKQIDLGIFRLEKKSKKADEKKAVSKTLFPIIIAPYLNERNLKRLAESEVSGIDLSGNGVVVVPGKLFVYRAGAKNKYPSNAPIKNVFRGTSSLCVRVFFAKPEYENVGGVLDEITARGGKTTLSTVSKVLKTLEEELLVGKGEKIRLLDGKKMLASLKENYRRPNERRRLIAKCADLPKALKRIAENAESKKLLYVRDDPARYAVMPQEASPVKIYTELINGFVEGVDYTETTRFPDIELIETDTRSVYFDRRKDRGFYWLSPLETYLELANEGKREQETADAMIKGLLDFKY